VKGLIYIRYEVLRTLRNRRFLIFSLAFPLILFFTVAGAHRHVTLDGIGFPLYYMTGMAAWGSMVAVISSGGRIAEERKVGWTRQLRITPLKTTSYFTAKVLTGYLMALFSIVILALAGVSLGVHLDATGWLTMLGLLLVGLIPFSVMGILLGHVIPVDSLGPAMGGITALFALLGGTFGPLFTSGAIFAVIKDLPSYWLVQAGKSALEGGHVWTGQAWIVIAVWSIVLAAGAVRVYRRDTQKV
jgi:ABC-2 type transport system permease protein